MSIKIVSDGTPHGTTFHDADTGEQVRGVVSAKWEMKDCDSIGVATLTFELASVDVVGEGLAATLEETDSE